MLFKYYHGLLDELILEQKEAVKPNVDQLFVEEQRKIAKELQNKAIEEANVGYGVYDGFQYENYIDNLNPEIKDTVINQLEFTKNLFEEAQKAKAVIMENGGTVEEARQVYLEMISVSRDTLDEFNKKNIEDESKVSEDESKVSEDESKVSEDE